MPKGHPVKLLNSRAEAQAAVSRLVAIQDESKAIKASLRLYVQVNGPVTASGHTAAFVDRPSTVYPAAAVLQIVKDDRDVPPLMLKRAAVRPLLLPPSPYADAIAAVGIRETVPTFDVLPSGD